MAWMMINFGINVLLRQVVEEDDDLEQVGVCSNRSSSRSNNNNKRKYKQMVDNILDLSGPRLFEGGKGWILYYQIIGQMNWIDKPFYFSLIYKLIVISSGCSIIILHHVVPLMSMSLIDSVYQNPIFIFICLSALITSTAHFWVTIYINLFKLSPLFKILTTPGLCFLPTNVQAVFGDNNLFITWIFIIYNTCLLRMLVSANLVEFVNNFSLIPFLLEVFSQSIIWYHVVGLAHFDFYIRCSFGCWLTGLKMNFENRSERFRAHQKRRLAEYFNRLGHTSGQSVDLNHKISHNKLPVDEFITLDKIQTHLNNMDDHLEVWRSVQAYSMALISVNAFLNNGTLLLFAYSLLANQGNYYHGLVVLGIALNYWLVIFLCYSADQFIWYALGKFVQTVEDEYFLQGSAGEMESSILRLVECQYQQLVDSTMTTTPDVSLELQPSLIGLKNKLLDEQREFQVKKDDVLFCREFLYQFSTHLATPWSRLNFNSHLHMLGTFVTLIAAQIIFDKEH